MGRFMSDALFGSESNDLRVSQAGAVNQFCGEVERAPVELIAAEFSRNSYQACAGIPGAIVRWVIADDGNWELVDTGCALDKEGMSKHLAFLHNSGGNTLGKHGVGARLLGLRVSPGGVFWSSLKNGWVACCEIWRPSRGGVSLTPLCKVSEVHLTDYLAAGMTIHPIILEVGRGTHVRFDTFPATGSFNDLGMSTMLSRRWFRLETDMWVDSKRTGPVKQSSFGWDDWQNKKRQVSAIGDALEALTTIKVSAVQLTGATATTYVLPETSDDLVEKFYIVGLFVRGKQGNKKAKAACGIMLEGEFYSLQQGGGAHSRLKRFGITHGMNRVVLVLDADPEVYVPNKQRTDLEPKKSETVEETKLPWDMWAEEFRLAMPEELRAYIREAMLGSEDERYDRLRDWYFGPMQPYKESAASAAATGGSSGGGGSGGGGSGGGGSGGGGSGGGGKNPTPPRRQRGGGMGKFWPNRIEWVTFPADDPNRTYVAAWFPGPGLLQMNAEWPRFTKRVRRQAKESGMDPDLAGEVVRQTYVVSVVDVISKAICESEPEPSGNQLAFGILMPNAVERTIADVTKLIGYASPVSVS